MNKKLGLLYQKNDQYFHEKKADEKRWFFTWKKLDLCVVSYTNKMFKHKTTKQYKKIKTPKDGPHELFNFIKNQ